MSLVRQQDCIGRRRSLLRRGAGSALGGARKRGKPLRYGAEVGEALHLLWEVGDRTCGKLLAGVIPDLVTALERHGELQVTPEVRNSLLAVSPATIDRLLRPWRQALGRQPRRKSPATTSLKAQIPIRTWSEWTEVTPGAL